MHCVGMVSVTSASRYGMQGHIIKVDPRCTSKVLFMEFQGIGRDSSDCRLLLSCSGFSMSFDQDNIPPTAKVIRILLLHL